MDQQAVATESPCSRPSLKVAIVGGGITGACAASTLLRPRRDGTSHAHNIQVDLFDQGRRGPGGRASHRRTEHSTSSNKTASTLRFDHGCQFFRADTPRFQVHVSEWMERGFVKKWDGTFAADTEDHDDSADRGFFGMPSSPPFYVGSDGINSVVEGVLDMCCLDNSHHALRINRGMRVATMERNKNTGKWSLYGTSGEIAYHDTPEEKVAATSSSERQRLGRSPEHEYDVVILTDVSSSFGSWHRASAGVPESFASKVRERCGARVPLFTAMVAFESKLNVPFDAVSFVKNDTIWFADRSSSKPGLGSAGDDKDDDGQETCDCWTIVSTPEYALAKIEETPMQDIKTGAFIPQSPSYLVSVPGRDLEEAFRYELLNPDGMLGREGALAKDAIPKTVYLDAQRWGSALPCHRSLNSESSTRRVISGVPYDGQRMPLAPTKVDREEAGDDGANFLADDELGLIQAGDMVSVYTPGFEGAALSGMDAAEHVLSLLLPPTAGS